MALRQDMISNAVDFLKDPRVISSPTDRKRKFLLSRGMTEEEIDEAFRLSSNPQIPAVVPVTGHSINQAPVQQNQRQTVPFPDIPWKLLAFLLVICTGLGNTLQFLFRKFVVSYFWPSPTPNPEQQALVEIKREMKSLTDQVKERQEFIRCTISQMRESTSLLQAEKKKYKQERSEASKQQFPIVESLKTEISDLKQLLPGVVQKLASIQK
eukprot:TRINITY_DN8316_c0_g1_i10.p1 TRINITY_DN8316_c0_g1~~TRINITY_DN8316_c0_g1_i10.p1  ORF type:complete len:211 (+),score=40.79 TRINITY_DN8316_c0_g1_i10:123-755(+)